MQFYNRKDTPYEWAKTQNSLGNAYQELQVGDHPFHIQQAISCYRAALLVYARENMQDEWALTQGSLGYAYWSIAGGVEQNYLERAIACFEAALRNSNQ